MNLEIKKEVKKAKSLHLYLIWIAVLLIVWLITNKTYAQIEDPVHWSYGLRKLSRTEAVILFKADIEGDWHIYSIHQTAGGPQHTSFTFTPSNIYVTEGEVEEPKYLTKHENAFNMDVHYFETQVIFQQKIKLKRQRGIITGKISFMTCNPEKCLPPEEVNFKVQLK